jgi:glycosyltransferase involved in cell wall biosynthesis
VNINSAKKPVCVCFVMMKAYPLFNPEIRAVFGGAEVDFYNLATELVRDENFDVKFIVADYGQPEIETRENVTLIRSLDFKKNLVSQTISLWRAMRQADASIYLQKAASWGTFFVEMFCKMNKRYFIYRTAKADESRGTWPKNYFERKAFWYSLRHADKVLVQNDADNKNLSSTLGISSIAIPNGHILSPIIKNSRDYVLWVGRSTKVKRPELFIDLAESTPDEKFVMVCQRGTGDNDYENIVSRAKQVKNLEFIERVPFNEIDSFFQRAKVLVNTSDTEGFPNTFIQACKCGTPILSLNVNPDGFLDSYKCGLCAKGDWNSFKNMLAKLLGLDSVEFGKNARLYVEQHHNIAKIIDSYKEIFYNLVQADAGGDN